jgi:hypothetical protein
MRKHQNARGGSRVRRLVTLVGLGAAIVVSGPVVGGADRSAPANATTAAHDGAPLMCNPFICGDNHNQVLL